MQHFTFLCVSSLVCVYACYENPSPFPLPSPLTPIPSDLVVDGLKAVKRGSPNMNSLVAIASSASLLISLVSGAK